MVKNIFTKRSAGPPDRTLTYNLPTYWPAGPKEARIRAGYLDSEVEC